jgi:hypothetical protein
MISKSSGYHLYEVEDVLQHLVGNIQVLLAADVPVKISGLGTMRVKKMKIKGIPGKHAENTCYTAFRLSVTSDTGLQNHLKENHVESTTIE